MLGEGGTSVGESVGHRFLRQIEVTPDGTPCCMGLTSRLCHSRPLAADFQDLSISKFLCPRPFQPFDRPHLNWPWTGWRCPGWFSPTGRVFTTRCVFPCQLISNFVGNFQLSVLWPKLLVFTPSLTFIPGGNDTDGDALNASHAPDMPPLLKSFFLSFK